jgi:hypothetical protein
MINQQLLDFIKNQLLKGVDKETISKELLENGWPEGDILEGFNLINRPSEKPKKIRLINKFVFIFIILIIIGFLGYIFRNDIFLIKNSINNDKLESINTTKTFRPTIVPDRIIFPTDKKQLEQLLVTYCNKDKNSPTCISLKSFIKNDVELCNSITDTESKYYCVLSVDPSKITPQLCDSIQVYVAPERKVYGAGVNVYNSCYSELANQTLDIRYCKNRINVMNENDTVDDYCLSNIALNNSNPDLCKEIINDNKQQSLCFMKIAKKNNNKDTCNMISDNSYKLICESYFK